MALIKCPDCGREVSSAAATCPNCSRPITPPKPEAKKAGCGSVLLVLVLFGVLGMGFCVVLIGNSAQRINEAAKNAPAPPPAPANPASTQPAPAAKTTPSEEDFAVRMFRRNVRQDDGLRELTFKRMLRSADQRCDSITSQVMGAPGVWTLECAPGYRYRFTFDAKGNPTGANRLP